MKNNTNNYNNSDYMIKKIATWIILRGLILYVLFCIPAIIELFSNNVSFFNNTLWKILSRIYYSALALEGLNTGVLALMSTDLSQNSRKSERLLNIVSFQYHKNKNKEYNQKNDFEIQRTKENTTCTNKNEFLEDNYTFQNINTKPYTRKRIRK